MSLDDKKTSYFMDKVFPELLKTFLAALLLVFTTWIKDSSTSKNPKDVPFSFGISNNLALLIYFLILLYALKIFYTSLKNLMVSFYDSKQLAYTFDDLDDPDLYYSSSSSITTDDSFSYQVKKGGDPSYHALAPIGLTDISNPKCAKDNCLTELICTKTTFGRYKYRCPFCNNKVKSDYDVSTLREQVRLIERKNLLVSSIKKAEKEREAEINKKAEEFLNMINDLEKMHDDHVKKTEGFFDDSSSPDLPRNEKELKEFEDDTK